MGSLSVHLNLYINIFYFLFHLVLEMKTPSLLIKERKAKTSSFLTPSRKHTMIEEFKDEFKDF